MVDGVSKVRETLTDRMRAARERGVVALQSYNILRSKVSEGVIIALEGGDDPIYYSTTIKMANPDFHWTPLVCNGKDHVLALRELISRNLGETIGKTFFIVDKDFDGLKAYGPHDNTYCTPGYSFENCLVSDHVLIQLLAGEFRCEPMGDEIACVVECFHQRLGEFLDAIRLANQTLHYCRIKGLRSGSVENKIRKYVKVTLESVTQQYDVGDLPTLVGLPEEEGTDGLSGTSAQFDALRPVEDWRGKFLMGFFIEFLSHLQEDRGKSTPQFFNSRKSISFSPRSSIVRVLSSITGPTDCLKDFVERMAA